MKMQRWEDAARMFKAQFTADTGASRAYYNYAQCKSALRDLKEAAKYYEVAIDHDPEFVPPYASVTTMHVLLEDYKTARRWAERTIEVIDTNVSKYGTELSQAYGYIGLDMLLAKNFDGAIKNLKKSIDLEPKNESALLWMALSLHNAQKLDEALRYYKLVLKVNKNNKQAQDGVTAIEGASK
jgi:tetratricopeptide (TPR) repeat protein